ncbi:concanavalin A-like lectin/glucanase domain-containing protein [Leptodontidium sp. 2 PMI_412]|nr:concanavalin A-like lectin/glucanase domain-containing protein [Leptodontidium sp. MPI-SDFR-AT-0119]KAH9208417.1 concanavalin A-like lectin/glucanase domain-containing protein [Leptodontidium sp. 2 PMI_412]
MKFSISAISALLAATAMATPTPVAIEKRATTMCGSWGTVATGGFTIYHNTWGSGKATSGSQCTTFNSLSSAGSVAWSTTWSWAGGPLDVKSYSNVALEKVNKKLSAISSIPSTWTWRYTGSNMVADVSYDLWLAPSVGANNQYEIMIWLGSYGGAGPISSTYNSAGNAVPVATPTILGTKWNLFKGPNGDTTVFSFVAPSNQGNFEGDLKLFFNYLTSSQGVSTSAVVTSLQAGTEPFTGSNAVFTTSKYTINVV